MRVITITFRENAARNEVESYADAGDKAGGSEMERLLADWAWPRIVRAMSDGAKAIAIGGDNDSVESLRAAAQIDIDIREAGR